MAFAASTVSPTAACGGVLEHQQLRRADAQQRARVRSGVRQRPFQEMRQHRVDAAQAAQRRGRNRAREGAVAAFERGEARRFVQRVFERAAALDDGDSNSAAARRAFKAQAPRWGLHPRVARVKRVRRITAPPAESGV